MLSLEGNCAECISSSSPCSLFPSEEEFAAVAKEKQELRREIREIERRRLNLEEQLDSVVDKEKALFDCKKDSLVELERLEAIHRAGASVSSTSCTSTTSTVVASPPLPSFSTNPGWFQADSRLPLDTSLSFNLSAFLASSSPSFDQAGLGNTSRELVSS